MKTIKRNKTVEVPGSGPVDGFPSRLQPWKVLIVDDEPDMHHVTRLNLKDFRFGGRDVDLLSANSAHQAQGVLDQHPDVAVALIDIVMETEDAGLRLVQHIREQLDNQLIRLLIRTGQPGMAPERYVIENYDIDGYHDKTDLTAQRLYTSVRSALKSYRDLRTLDTNRIGLTHVLNSTEGLYRTHIESLSKFYQGVLTQITGLFRVGDSSLLATIDGLAITVEGRDVQVQAGTGTLSPEAHSPRIDEIVEICSRTVIEGHPPHRLRADCMLLPLRIDGEPVGFIYLEHTDGLAEQDRDLLHVMANQCAGALANLRLHLELTESYDRVVNMLALVSEYRDATTGEHINRIAHLTRTVAVEMGLDAAQAKRIGDAARLHDAGKVGIPDQILQKPGPLDDWEFELVKKHTTMGASILEHDSKLALAREIALWHHERWNGAGYPDGLAGSEIPLPARIVSVVDVYDALTNERPYKQAWPAEDALNYIVEQKGLMFDPGVVDAFLRVVPFAPR